MSSVCPFPSIDARVIAPFERSLQYTVRLSESTARQLGAAPEATVRLTPAATSSLAAVLTHPLCPFAGSLSRSVQKRESVCSRCTV